MICLFLIIQFSVKVMKRIAFISSGFTGSILPLAVNLLKQNYQIDLYLIIFKAQNQKEHEALEINHANYFYGIHSIPKKDFIGIEYLKKNQNFRLFLVCNFGIAKGKSLFKQQLSKILQETILLYLSTFIKYKKYDFINTIGHDYFITKVAQKLHTYPICHTFHEIIHHDTRACSMLKPVLYIMKSKIPIIVPSQYLLKHILKTDNTYPAYYIPFGIFNGYKTFINKEYKINVQLPQEYFLFIGNILPYKGLDVLYKASRLLQNKGYQIKIVIAGNGTSELLQKLREDNNFTIINRWISNTELVTLVQKSKGIICPYLSASQSGIPMVAYLFKKPVIVTNVGAMAEYVIDNETGFVIKKGDAQTLADKIELIHNNPQLFNEEKIKQGINHLNFNWESITNKYIKTLNQI